MSKHVNMILEKDIYGNVQIPSGALANYLVYQAFLEKGDTYDILDVLDDKVFGKIDTDIYMFNPMGMSSYDIAIGNYFIKK